MTPGVAASIPWLDQYSQFNSFLYSHNVSLAENFGNRDAIISVWNFRKNGARC